MAGFWKTTQYITRRLILKNGATIGDTSGNVFVGGNIIPQAHVTNVLYVSPTFVSNTLNNFKTATSAVARAISIATAQMPVVIKVQPGTYNETVAVPQYVYLERELGVSGLNLTNTGGGIIVPVKKYYTIMGRLDTLLPPPTPPNFIITYNDSGITFINATYISPGKYDLNFSDNVLYGTTLMSFLNGPNNPPAILSAFADTINTITISTRNIDGGAFADNLLIEASLIIHIPFS